jgi:iron complex outermembrane recepter protein
VEVLRGPQGTLYGRNSTGGVINLISTRPVHELGGNGEIEGGNYGLYRIEGGVNLPASETFAMRLAFRKYKHRGYYDSGLDDANQTSGRLSGLWTPSDAFKLYASADYEVSDRLGNGTGIIEARRPAAAGTVVQPLNSQLVNSDPFKLNAYNDPYYQSWDNKEKQTTWGANVQADWELSFADLTAQIGNRHLKMDWTTTQGTSGIVPNPAGSTTLSRLPGLDISPASSSTWSGEVRLTAKPDNPLQWVAGLFYFRESMDGGRCQTPTKTSTVCALDLGLLDMHTKSYAAFGQVTWTPPSMTKLHLTGGIRYSNDDKDGISTLAVRNPATGQALVYWYNAVQLIGPPAAAAGVAIPGAVAPGRLTQKGDQTTGVVNIAYDITDANMAFLRLSTGYQAGGIAYGSSPLFEPEKVTAYELGSRNRFLNNRLQVNVDAWYYDYKGQTQTVTVPNLVPPNIPGLLDLTVASIGKLMYKGISANVLFAATDRSRLEFFAQYLPSANYVSFLIPSKFPQAPLRDLNGVPIAGSNAQNISGQRVPNAPKVTGRVGYSYTFNLANGTLEPQVDVQWAGRTQISTTTVAGTIQNIERNAYQSGDVSLQYTPTGGRWSIRGYVNNVTDERVPFPGTYALQTGLVVGGFMTPRTYGATLRLKF